MVVPSVATYAPTAADAGLIYDDIWDETARASIPSSAVISSDPNYLVLGHIKLILILQYFRLSS
jgi:hypothetical protein